ncbi:MAG: hypothetical protein L6Q47_08085 [Ignavibacteriaceae bacterium]|nr:hypothetical protein [Ignavibacteriaceae bacterium]
MNRLKRFFLILPFLIFGLAGCSENTTDPGSQVVTDDQALQELALEDSSVLSFEQNFNDDGAMGFFFGKTQEAIYPLKIGRRISSVTRQFSRELIGDSAYVTVTSTYTGVMIIAASFEPVTPGDTTVTADTVIQKPFTSEVVRKLIFRKVNNNPNPRNNWRLVAVSLPSGGTVTNNVSINKAVLTYANGDSLVITNPNDFFLSRNPSGARRDIPVLNRNATVTLRVEIFSTYADDDFVILTHGANLRGFFRVKKRLELISSEPSGAGFVRVYSHTFASGSAPGHFHAIIDAMPRGVVFDSGAAVENKSWGVPYIVR